MSKDQETMDFVAIEPAERDIVAKYHGVMLDAINSSITSGELSEIMQTAPIVGEVQAQDCTFSDPECYRLNQTDMMVYIDASVSTNIVEEDGTANTEYQDLVLSLFVTAVGGRIEASCEKIQNLWDKPIKEGEKLTDEWYIPRFDWDDVEACGAAIWYKYDREAFRDQSLRRAKRLAQKMGLIIEEQCGSPKGPMVRLVLALEDEEGSPGDKLILNISARHYHEKCELEIYRACFAYEYHYLFYAMHGIHEAHPECVPLKEVPFDADLAKKNPLNFLADQVIHGAYVLMMPQEFMKDFIDSHLPETADMTMQHGYMISKAARLEALANMLCERYNLQPKHVRTRLRQLQQPEAKCIFITTSSGKYNLPYSISKEQLKAKNKTFCIGKLTDIFKVYNKDEQFRELVASGNYEYADGMIVCLDKGTYMRDPDRGVILSPKANSHADRYCLRFHVSYNSMTHYTYKYDKQYAAPMCPEDSPADRKAWIAWMTAYDTFHELLTALIRTRSCSSQLTESGFIKEKVLQSLCSQEYGWYDPDLIVGICIALRLKPWASEILMQKAHVVLPEHDDKYRRALLCLCHHEDFRHVQRMLENDYELSQLTYKHIAA